MDKSWMHKSRSSSEYLNGVIEFLNFAFDHATNDDKIPCPCIKCCNKYYKNREDVHGDLLWNGIMQIYINWTSHGEDIYGGEYISDESEEGDDMHEMLHDAFGMPNLDGGEDNESPEESIPDEPNMEAQKFYKLLKDAEIELYPGSTKFSKLSFLVRLFHLKCLNGWSNKSFDMLLELLKEALPVGEMLPKNHYESKKILRDLGLHYIKIDACPNDCMLYWKEYENTNECTICGESRWKSMKRGRPNSNPSSQRLSVTDQEVYNLIKSKQGMGILIGDLKHELKLQDGSVKKSLKTLENQRLIKNVVDVHHKLNKYFLAVEFEPSKEITGGCWYLEGKLDKEFITFLKELCLKYIEMIKVTTIEGLFEYVRGSDAFNVEFTRDQMLEIVQALVLDNEIEEVQSSGQGDFSSIPLGKVCYRRSKRRLSTAALTSIPCGVCPRINECTPDGIISPINCVYFKKWLDF
eukprot:TRINITY_DN2010_c0_g2_i4.p1 TRINITY_DN2010_c0_g2~~TRINITY_DN2010_c0_g2_i4.p1  ORF type:complete len:465 (-),score=57.82 TRINITY_DN2010_c0_g2_i4:857-2251(-)